jgi:hypothetical protein
MNSHAIWLYAHILLFVFWLGADVGVFLTMHFVKDARLSFETRATLIKLAFYIDLSPRIAFALILPVGVELIRSLDLYPIAPGLRWLVWAVGLAWAAMHVTIVIRKGTALAVWLRKINVAFETIMGAVMVWIGAISLVTEAPVNAPWLALKLLLFGLIFWIVLGIDIRFQPFTMILTMGAGGSTPEREAEIRRATNLTMGWALLLYALIAAIAFLGTSKPI